MRALERRSGRYSRRPFVALTAALSLVALLASASARASEPNAEARRLYAEGKAEYAQGHYAEAIGLFERSFALSESSALLFNLAQAHRLLGPAHCRAALSLYQSYLAAEPQAENHQEVEERIAQLADCSAREAAEATAAPTPAAEAPAEAPVAIAPSSSAPPPASPPSERPLTPRRSGVPTGPVLVTGTGAALLVAGGVLYWRVREKHSEAKKRCPCYPGTYSSWELLSNVSYALLAVGGATLAGGVTWWVAAEPSKNGHPAGALLSLAGSF